MTDSHSGTASPLARRQTLSDTWDNPLERTRRHPESAATPQTVDALGRAYNLPGQLPQVTNDPIPWMAAPMVQGKRTVGCITVFGPERPFGQEDVEWAAAVARRVAVALKKRHVFAAERRGVNQLSAVNQLAQQAATQHGAEDLATTTLDLGLDLIGGGVVWVFLTDPLGSERLLHVTLEPTGLPQICNLRMLFGGCGIGEGTEQYPATRWRLARPDAAAPVTGRSCCALMMTGSVSIPSEPSVSQRPSASSAFRHVGTGVTIAWCGQSPERSGPLATTSRTRPVEARVRADAKPRKFGQ